MIRSMTGYSSARAETPDFSVSISIKSTNHRFLDLQFRLPSGLEPIEILLRRIIKEEIKRGHVEVTVTLEQKNLAELPINRRLIEAYLHTCQQLRDEFRIQSDLDLLALLRIPGVVGTGSDDDSKSEAEAISRALHPVVREALLRLNEMRLREGKALESDVRERCERLRVLGGRIADLARSTPQLYQRRLEHRLQEMLGNAQLDPGRMTQEVAFLASRSDISEELTRFMSHLDQAAELLTDGAEAGKKLDFLLQEMNRETNTLLSKTTDVPEAGLEIARNGIEMKTEIEKLREQALNIE